MQNLLSNNYKIGITKNKDINKRLKSLKTGSDGELLLINKYLSKHYKKIEKKFHIKYNSKRVTGEWFCLNDEEAMNFSKDCEYFNEIFDSLNNNPFFN